MRWLLLAVAFTLAGCSDDGDTSAGAGGGGGGGGSPSTSEPTLPAPTGACPDFAAGDVTFSPAGVAPRTVRIFMNDSASTLDGPLVFYWHGTGSNPRLEPPYGLGEAQNWVLDQGGIVAALYSDPSAGTFPWFLTTGGENETDLVVADEVLACAIEKVGVDTHRIHSIGMSAGGLQTTQMSYRRSGYIASVVTYSGGLITLPETIQDETNRFAAMIFHGGPGDIVLVNFQDLSTAYLNDLGARGHFGFLCNHGGGHVIPKDEAAQPSVMAFFRDHPWGTAESPYAEALPGDFPPYCSL